MSSCSRSWSPHFIENFSQNDEEVKVQLQVGFVRRRVAKLYAASNKHLKMRKSPTGWQEMESRGKKWLLVIYLTCMHVSAYTGVCVCVTPLHCFDFEVLTLSQAERWENRNAATWGLEALVFVCVCFTIFLSKWKFVRQEFQTRDVTRTVFTALPLSGRQGVTVHSLSHAWVEMFSQSENPTTPQKDVLVGNKFCGEQGLCQLPYYHLSCFCPLCWV